MESKQCYQTVPEGVDLVDRLTTSKFEGLEFVRSYEPTDVDGIRLVYHFNLCTVEVNNSKGVPPLQIHGKTDDTIEEEAKGLSRLIGVKLKRVPDTN